MTQSRMIESDFALPGTARNAAEFVRYLVGGTIAALTQFAILVALVELAEVDPTASSTLALAMAIVVNYHLQYHWTFNAQGRHGVVFRRYLVVTLLTLAANGLIFGLLTVVMGLWYPAAQAVATGLIVVVNYLLNRHYTFATKIGHSL